jgi:hypothetical protein
MRALGIEIDEKAYNLALIKAQGDPPNDLQTR